MTSDYEVYRPANPYYFPVMKKHIVTTALILGSLLTAACHRNDIRTQTFKIDQLRSQEAVQLIAQSLQKLDGVQKLNPDIEARTLTVIFNGRALYLKNIEYEIVHAGFSLPHWPAPAAAKAKLPEDLR